MYFHKRLIFKWLLIGGIGLAITVFGVSIILNLAVSLMEKKEAVLSFGESVDGVGDYFTFLRLSIVVLLIFYWKEIVRVISRWQKLNLRQVFFLKTLHPYIAGSLVLIELLGLAFK